MTGRLAAVSSVLLWSAATTATGVDSQSAASPLDLLRPCVVLAADDVAKIQAGSVIVRTLDENEHYIAVFGVRRISADGDRLVAWIREIAQLKQSHLVEEIARFSDPPADGDLDGLTLDGADLQALRECQVGNCRVKLTAGEIALVRHEFEGLGAQWRRRADLAFRQVLLGRVKAYRNSGHAAIGQYADGRSPETLDAVADALLERTPCLREHAPVVARYLTGSPGEVRPGVESFMYWSKERVAGRPIISATHVVIARQGAGQGNALVVGRQVFATHYLNGSLNLTAVLGGGPGTPHYLVLLNRSNVDVVGGFFGGLVRRSIERRLRSELSGILDQLARRLEGGLPSNPKYSAPDASRREP